MFTCCVQEVVLIFLVRTGLLLTDVNANGLGCVKYGS